MLSIERSVFVALAVKYVLPIEWSVNKALTVISTVNCQQYCNRVAVTDNVRILAISFLKLINIVLTENSDLSNLLTCNQCAHTMEMEDRM